MDYGKPPVGVASAITVFGVTLSGAWFLALCVLLSAGLILAVRYLFRRGKSLGE